MRNKIIKQVKTSSFPDAVEYNRLLVRWVNGKNGLEKTYTVTTKNNCIQGNFDSLEQATEIFNKMAGV